MSNNDGGNEGFLAVLVVLAALTVFLWGVYTFILQRPPF